MYLMICLQCLAVQDFPSKREYLRAKLYQNLGITIDLTLEEILEQHQNSKYKTYRR